MCRCYQGAALVLGGILLTGFTSLNSCSAGTLTVYAAEEALSEEKKQLLQEEIQTEEKNVETEVPAEESAEQPEEGAEEAPPADVQTAGNSFSLEEQEYQVLLKIVEAEAGCEDTEGKMLVANVVMNRVRSSRFPDTVSEVVYQNVDGLAQFSPTADGRIDQVSISQDTIEAVARVMNGEDQSAGALFFRAVSCPGGWFDRALTRIIEHGNHIFYTM